jgi:hypothetical protein
MLYFLFIVFFSTTACRLTALIIYARSLCICATLQLIESYRIIIDTTTALSNDPSPGQGRPPSLEALQRISQSASLGLRLLGSTTGTEPPGTIPHTETPGANPGSAEEGDVAAAKRQACYAVHLHEA